jgi:hypothetical protein
MSRQPRKSLLEVLWSRIKKTPASPPAVVAPRPFQAVSIYCGIDPCPNARRLKDERFLAKDAPPLPLGNCSRPKACECRYLKHKDRRSESRRFAEFAMRRELSVERRRRRGRRATDK